MTRPVRILAVMVALLIPAAAQAREPRVLVNSSHHGAVTGIASQSATGRAFTAGSDGTVRVWDSEEHNLQRILPVSPFEVLQLTAAHNLSLIAAVSPEGRTGYRLGIWNWRTGREIYHFTLNREPLTIEFSPGGNFLVYTVPEFRSLRFVNLRTGEHEDWVPRGFGITSSVTIASSEARIMTYIPAGGRIQYWDLETGDEIQRVTTYHDLEQLTLLRNRRHAVGATRNDLVVVDVVNGETRAQAALSEVVAIRRDPETDQLGVVRRSSGSYEFSRWEYAGGRLRRIAASRALGTTFSDLTFHRGRVLVAHSDGQVTYFYPFSRVDRVFAEPRTRPVESVIAAGHDLHLTVGSELLSLSSDFFGVPGTLVQDARFLQYDSLSLPYEQQLELSLLKPDEYIVWSGAIENSQLYLLHTRRGEVADTQIEVPNRIRRVVPSGDSYAAYILDDTGVIRRYDFKTGDSAIVYQAPGIQTFTRLDEGRLLIAGSTDHAFDTPVVSVDTQTGETVPITVNGFYILDMDYDADGDTLYVLALEGIGPRNDTHTTLTSYRRLGLAAGTRLVSHPGEDLGATLRYDRARRKLYTTVGFKGVQVFDDTGRVSTLERTVETPERVHVYQDRVFGINRSGSLSIWDAQSGAHVLEFHSFQDGNWAVITPKGQFAMARPQFADEYLSLIPGRVQPTDLRAFELSISIQEP